MDEKNLYELNKLFSSMNEDDFEKFLHCASPSVKEFSKNEIILGEGEKQESLILILSGEVELYKEDYEGNRSLVGMLYRGESYGEQTIFGNGVVNGFTVTAGAPTKIMYIDKGLFSRPCSKVCSTHQILIQNMLGLLANQTNLLEKKIAYLTAKSLRRKIALYLLEQYQSQGEQTEFEIPFNREEMAEYFDVQRPSLSRELVSLKTEGILDWKRRRFKILELEKLVKIAN